MTRRPRKPTTAVSSQSASTRLDPFEEDDRRQTNGPEALPSDPSDIQELPPPIRVTPAQDSLQPESQPFQLPSEQSRPDPLRDDDLRDLEPLDRTLDDDFSQDNTQEAGSFGDCESALATVKANVLSRIDLDITLEGQAGQDFPEECTFGDERYQPRRWPHLTYNWKASALCHKPLYFEDPHLERYGHEMGPYLQPFLSAAHFFGALPLLPYKMGMKTPHECVYVLGHYRPGNCSPYLCEPIGFTGRAAAFETLAVLGVIFVVP